MRKQKVLARGAGVQQALEVCKVFGWDESNSTLVVDEPHNIYSEWTLWSK